MLFATYGVVLDIVALKTAKMRGQAHVVFKDIDSSTQAMRALQGFSFFGKEMVDFLSPAILCSAILISSRTLLMQKANRIQLQS